jgi:hypothetical protein
MMNHVAILQGFTSRHINSPQDSDTTGIGAAYRYLYREFEKIREESNNNFVVFPHQFRAGALGRTTTQYNIVGIINGSEPNTGVIVVGGHYDSTDMFNQENAPNWAPGADDNGSGVAAIIEMARILSKQTPRRTLVFVLFSAEEHDRQGSRAFVRDYIQAMNIPVEVMINIDTIGSNNDRFGNVNDTQIRLFANPGNANSLHYGRMINFIADNHASDLEIVVNQQIDREGRFGDHFSFDEVGIAAVRFIESLEDTNFREGTDTIQYIEPDYLRRATRTIMTVVVALADGPRPPSELAIRDLGNGIRRLVWTPIDGARGYMLAARRPGQTTYAHYFPVPQGENALDCECFVAASFEAMAIAAVNEDGIMGPLSLEYRVP